MVAFRQAEEYMGVRVGRRVRIVGKHGDYQDGSEGVVTAIHYVGPMNIAVSEAVGRMPGAVRRASGGGAVINLSQFAWREKPPFAVPGGWRILVRMDDSISSGLPGFPSVRPTLHLRRDDVVPVPSSRGRGH